MLLMAVLASRDGCIFPNDGRQMLAVLLVIRQLKDEFPGAGPC